MQVVDGNVGDVVSKVRNSGSPTEWKGGLPKLFYRAEKGELAQLGRCPLSQKFLLNDKAHRFFLENGDEIRLFEGAPASRLYEVQGGGNPTINSSKCSAARGYPCSLYHQPA